MSDKRESITKFEVLEQDGSIVSRQTTDTVLEDVKDIDKMIAELDRQIAVFENTLNSVQETIKQLREQRQAFIDFRNTKGA